MFLQAGVFKKITTVFLFFGLFSSVFSGIYASNVKASEPELSKRNQMPGVGVNKHDLFTQYLGTSFWSGPRALMEDMAFKSIVDAQNAGIGYFRVSVSGFGDSELNYWRLYPVFFWQRFDLMMNDLYSHNVKIIPVLNWDLWQFPLYTGEGMHKFMTDSSSLSRKLFSKYVGEIVSRYKYHPAVLFWELGNEWNLNVDLDADGRSNLKGHNVSTDELIGFVKFFSGYIRSIDSGHLISSGFSLPRASAEHLRKQPEWSADGPDWTEDSREEFQKNLLETNQDVDIVSIHIYNFCWYQDCRRRDSERFDIRGAFNADILDEIKAITDKAGKLLFIGEYNDFGFSWRKLETTSDFTLAVLDKIARLKIPFSAFWAWETYQLSESFEPADTNLEPGLTDPILQKMKETNESFFRISPKPEIPDRTPPMAVIISPFEGSALVREGFKIYAAATDNDKVERVEFWINKTFLGSDFEPPYSIKVPAENLFLLGPFLTLRAKAFDRSGNHFESWVRIINGKSPW